MGGLEYFCFDIGGVASKVDPEIIVAKAREKWPDYSWKKFKQMLVLKNSPHPGSHWRKFQAGLISAEEYLTTALQVGGYPVSDENKQHFAEIMGVMSGEPYQNITNLVLDLKKSSYHTSVLSNNNEIMYNSPGAIIRKYVDVSISSHHIGVSKPNPVAFRTLLERIEADDPGKVLFVDDKVKNIKAFEKLGGRGFVFRSKEVSMDEAFDELVEFLTKEDVRIKCYVSTHLSD